MSPPVPRASGDADAIPARRRPRFHGPVLNTALMFALVAAAESSLPCRAQTEWHGRSELPTRRMGAAMAYDSARGVTVLFGGENPSGVFNSETWEWNGSAWTQRAVVGPSARAYHAMAYDSARHVTVLFGGSRGVSTYIAETWEWDGVEWIPRQVAGPAGRRSHAMAYDSGRGVTVLFGGATCLPCSANNETWEWNGVTWVQRQVTGIDPRKGSALAYDSRRGVTVLFGGLLNGSPGYVGDTWEWDGTVWRPRGEPGPPPRAAHAMAYNSVHGVTVLFGGIFPGGWPYDFNDTWEWDGVAWTQRASSGPGMRESHAMAYDSARRVTVMCGGYAQLTNGIIAGTWEWGTPCYANCDTSTLEPILNVADFACFMNRFASGDSYANCDNSTTPPTLSIPDFYCFLNRFASGCS